MSDKANKEDEGLPSYEEYQKKATSSYSHIDPVTGEGLVEIYINNDDPNGPKPNQVLNTSDLMNFPRPPPNQTAIRPTQRIQVQRQPANIRNIHGSICQRKVIYYITLLVIIVIILTLIIVMTVQYVNRK